MLGVIKAAKNAVVLRNISNTRGFHVSSSERVTQYLQIPGSTSSQDDRELAYQKINGIRKPGIIYVPGFMADKSSVKATALHSFCQEYGFPYVRYDPTSLGESSKNITFKAARFSHWLKDAEAVLTRLTEGPQLIIGSSMGAWITTILTSRYPDRVSGVLLLAPGINFARDYAEKMRMSLPKTLVDKLENGEAIEYYHPQYGTIPLSFDLFQDMMSHEMDLSAGACNINCPVRIIHGTIDEDVDYKKSLEILEAVKTNDVQLLYLKNVGHTLSEDTSLKVIQDTILQMSHKS